VTTKTRQQLDLYYHAVIGSMVSYLLHQLAGSLTITSLNLHELKSHFSTRQIPAAEKKQMITRALVGCQQLEELLQLERQEFTDWSEGNHISFATYMDLLNHLIQHQAQQHGFQFSIILRQRVKFTAQPFTLFQILLLSLYYLVKNTQEVGLSNLMLEIRQTGKIVNVLIAYEYRSVPSAENVPLVQPLEEIILLLRSVIQPEWKGKLHMKREEQRQMVGFELTT
jgi:hypothetical protein